MWCRRRSSWSRRCGVVYLGLWRLFPPLNSTSDERPHAPSVPSKPAALCTSHAAIRIAQLQGRQSNLDLSQHKSISESARTKHIDTSKFEQHVERCTLN